MILDGVEALARMNTLGRRMPYMQLADVWEAFGRPPRAEDTPTVTYPTALTIWSKCPAEHRHANEYAPVGAPMIFQSALGVGIIGLAGHDERIVMTVRGRTNKFSDIMQVEAVYDAVYLGWVSMFMGHKIKGEIA